MRKHISTFAIPVISMLFAACGGQAVTPPTARQQVVTPSNNQLTPNVMSVQGSFSQFNSPATPIGGIAITKNGVYLNAVNELMRYNAGTFSEYTYPSTYDYSGTPLQLNAGSGPYSLAAESNGTVISFGDGAFFPDAGAPFSVLRLVTLQPNGNISESYNVTSPLVVASYDMAVPGPFGSVYLVEMQNLQGDSILTIAPTGTPGIATGSNLYHDSITCITQGPDGMTYVALGNPGPEILQINPGTGAILQTTPVTGYVMGMTAGPDHAVWFSTQQQVGRLSGNGNVKYYNVGGMRYITAGSDNAIWGSDGTTLYQMTSSGHVTNYVVPPNVGTILSLNGSVPGLIYFPDTNGLGTITLKK